MGVEVGGGLMNRYLEEGGIPAEQVRGPFERALREEHLLPVAFVSARTGAGIPELLDIFARLAPSPREGNPHPFAHLTPEHAEPIRVEPDPTHPLVSHVFKFAPDHSLRPLPLLRL